ncbi:MAG: tRNA uridine-5-carboxymethylaminomethyl(34) synthesis enzyme MnmG [Clostridia bacterium]|nr:tRNA uridine-5-carboxymethylaminomethyl(34) synthesis enzyme MnmG [Clostridia bacterium]
MEENVNKVVSRENDFDVAVIGGGHAGCEAASAAARLGCKTVMFTINLDAVGNMPCNPSIGGTAKGHLVREIDALGGIMGKLADKTLIQSRMLNTGKGPAVHSLRAQIDRAEYRIEMKNELESTPNLTVRQAEVKEITKTDGGFLLKIHTGLLYFSKAVIVATGTYLEGRVIVGETIYDSGPDGMFPSKGLSQSLADLGIKLMRFKTGTPPRVHEDSIDYSCMSEQKGDEPITPFSFETERELENKIECHLTYTNEGTHEILRQNIHRSPLFAGVIEGVGPRYCPSIEDKVMRFADKERHQLFMEPMGLRTKEVYVQGLSSSMPEEIQTRVLRSIAGLENAVVMRCAYAIEYDCCDPTQLTSALEFREIPNLYGAGQFNGTSGYEEAAAQGLVAGINAAMKLKGRQQLTLDRSEAYIGVLIDDLVTKGTNEPYRMLTSRAEYRLLLRQDNADRRLTPKGHEIGLISDERYAKYLKKQEMIDKEVERIKGVSLSPAPEITAFLDEKNSPRIDNGAKMCDLIKRAELDYESLAPFDTARPTLPRDVREEVGIMIKYEGYLKRQSEQVERFKKNEERKIPKDINYAEVYGLRIEARQKLEKLRPENVGQAGRISGVSPADVAVLLIYLLAQKR